MKLVEEKLSWDVTGKKMSELINSIIANNQEVQK